MAVADLPYLTLVDTVRLVNDRNHREVVATIKIVDQSVLIFSGPDGRGLLTILDETKTQPLNVYPPAFTFAFKCVLLKVIDYNPRLKTLFVETPDKADYFYAPEGAPKPKAIPESAKSENWGSW